MKSTLLTVLLLLTAFCTSFSQTTDFSKKPNAAKIQEAKTIVNTIFTDLKNNRHEKVADFMVESIGKTWDAATKIKNKNDYLSKMQIISVSPPEGVYGSLDGYDLIEEAYLPGSDRYFRHTYISYHEGSKLIWEFRFYINSKQKLTIDYIGWSEKNPFEYMSTSDMLAPRYFN
ncbi:hypothetical protein [Pontibacter akesuensis]|uniref:Nuclear transport factor 2 family protein n=1 Tax=Pontibacter akesuensis TaxID=388950 RepID=A0A1I7FPN3_9BACT|nr:hypothetical protein [Pontibacter akesuensis]GHA61092.1 hypothetical protein GCM10007389_11870 [Pontibacter akesuensis]SFU38159.1 hypothetical protein SAMN04487941_0375 [Pontibacter akesuensis]